MNKRLACCLAAVLSLMTSTFAETGTFIIQNGQSPWHDRIGKWELTDVPASLAGTTPLPQQSCSDRNLVLPEGTTSVLFAAATSQLPTLQSHFLEAIVTPETLAVRNPSGGGNMPYSVVYLATPPPIITGPFSAGLILLAINAPSPVTSAPPAATPQATVAATPGTPLDVPANKEQFEIYLLMGQSNMLGRDVSKLNEQVDNPRIGSMDKTGGWEVAREPLWGGSGTGPGIFFAEAMLAHRPEGVKIGLVSTAAGGTSLSRWVKGSDLYQRALTRAKLAMQAGVLKGILWHQGESDSNTEENASTYQQRLTTMLSDLRNDLGNPDLPIVVGQLGEFLIVDRLPYAATVREAIANVSKTVPHVGFAGSQGLTDKGDHLHFNADSQAEFGKRYAKAMLELQAK